MGAVVKIVVRRRTKRGKDPRNRVRGNLRIRLARHGARGVLRGRIDRGRSHSFQDGNVHKVGARPERM